MGSRVSMCHELLECFDPVRRMVGSLERPEKGRSEEDSTIRMARKYASSASRVLVDLEVEDFD